MFIVCHLRLWSYDVDEVGKDIFYVFICQSGVEWEGYLIVILFVGVREILDIETEGLVGRHHREWFVVNVCGDSSFRHLYDDVVALLHRDARNACHEKMTAGGMFVAVVWKHKNTVRLQSHIVSLDELTATAQHLRITF